MLIAPVTSPVGPQDVCRQDGLRIYDLVKVIEMAADERGEAVFSRKLARGKLLDFFAAQPACLVAMEACGGAHHWARELTTAWP